MITPMQKLSILCLASDTESSLNALRDLGVLHVTPCTESTGVMLAGTHPRAEQATLALSTLDAYDPHPHSRHRSDVDNDPDALIDAICENYRRHRHLEEHLANLLRTRHTLIPYGEFSADTIQSLAKRGIMVKLYHARKIAEVSAPEGTQLHVLSTDKTGTHFAIIGLNDFETEASEFHFPPESLSQINTDIATTETELGEINTALQILAAARPKIEQALHEREEASRFADVHDTMGSHGALIFLRGYCPTESLTEVRTAAAQHGWGLSIEDPAEDEVVPTLIKYPRWVKPIKSVLDVLGILPGYDEIDVSAAFLVFFSLFFGMLVGDAGYGLIFLIMAFLMRWKMPAVPKRAFVLLAITSTSTIVWGAISGTWFGIANLPAPLRGLTIPWLRSEQNVMELCFLIGAIHLTLAHGWAAWRSRRRLQALAQLGWILSTWMMFFLARWLVLGYDKPEFVWPAVGVAAVFIALFMTPAKKLKTEWFGHAMLPLDIISNFVDVVSYVRLFAVGAASLAVAAAFNEMALGGGISGPVSAIVAALILFLGHALNLIMAVMGVMVHGIRLNTLEFSGHIGVEWKGYAYSPFAHTAKPADGCNTVE